MRRGLWLNGAMLAMVGCFHPFSWPEDRVAAPKPAAEVTAELPPDDVALSRAAECLERGESAEALPYLRIYLRANPTAVMIRANIAELLFRLGRGPEARSEFERFVRDAESMTGAPRTHLVHCHTRLMSLAEQDADPYREMLHRGIGLVLLVRRWEADPDPAGEALTEQTLVKAVAALRSAMDERSGSDARAGLYLAEAYERLGQMSAARSARLASRAALPDPALTPSELNSLLESTTDRPISSRAW